LLSATGFLLLIACVNVANLLLARNSSRQREMAVRTALGARNGRLKRQFVTESLWLAITGGLLGLGLAVIGVANAHVLGAAQIPRLEDAAIDLRVLGVTAMLVVLTSLLFGVLPASRFVRQDVNKSLRSGTRGTADRVGVRTRRLLVVSEIALATVLLVGSGLTLRSLQRLTAVDPGLETDKVVTARISLAARYSEASQRVDFFNRLVDGLRNRPGITAAGAISVLPLTGDTEDWAFSVENFLKANGRAVVTEQTRFVTGEYFRTLGIPLKEGRGFDHFDGRVDAPRVAIVSESFARKYWKDSEAVGKRLKLATRRDDSPWISVVGVVGDIRHLGPHVEQQPFIYYPAAQYNQSRMALVVRSDSAPGTVASAIREEVGKLDAEQAVFGIRTMAEYASESIGQFRFTSLILTFIGTLALLLASVGIYGVMAHSISQRTHEIGVRLALGAMRSSIFGSIVGQGFVLASIGICLGAIGGFFVGRSMQTQLFDVGPLDPIALGGAVAVLFAISLLASYFPARRATRIDPATALRME